MPKRNVLFIFPSDRAEGSFDSSRWQSWRSSIELCRHPDFPLHRVVIVYSQLTNSLAHLMSSDIGVVNPALEVRLLFLPRRDKHSVDQNFLRSLDFLESYEFDYGQEEYFVRLGTGATYASIMSIVLLLTSGYMRASMVTLSEPIEGEPEHGVVQIFNPDVGAWLRLAAQSRRDKLDSVCYLKAGIETRNPRYNTLLEKLEHVALNTASPILISGATGSGKSVLAQRIYELKKRSGLLAGELVAVNCSTLHGDLALSTLFGHVKGSFTGALLSRDGLMKKAHNGILFLDEIGDLPPDCQAKVLTALETKNFYPLGSDRTCHSDFQLICCTNRDLGQEVAAGRFREDLLARISLWNFQLPPLCERKDDIEPNLSYELQRLTEICGRKIFFIPRARDIFLHYATAPETRWGGNFRELAACLERMAVMSENGIISEEVVLAEISDMSKGISLAPGQERKADCGQPTRFPLIDFLLGTRADDLDPFDKVQLEYALSVCRTAGSRSAAGKALFPESRKRRKNANDTDRLNKYLAKFGLDWQQVQAAETAPH